MTDLFPSVKKSDESFFVRLFLRLLVSAAIAVPVTALGIVMSDGLVHGVTYARYLTFILVPSMFSPALAAIVTTNGQPSSFGAWLLVVYLQQVVYVYVIGTVVMTVIRRLGRT